MKTEEQLKSTYHSIIRENSGVPLEQDETDTKLQQQKQENEAIKRTLVVQWLTDGVTQSMFKELDAEILSLETLAREKACAYAVHQNHLEIVNLLVRSAELRKLKQKYVS